MVEDWGRFFEDRFRWEVGNGKELFFWEDNWRGSGVRKSKFQGFSHCQYPKILSFFIARIGLITFGCGILFGEWDFFIRRRTRSVNFLRWCMIQVSLWKIRRDGFRRMVITLSIQLILGMVF